MNSKYLKKERLKNSKFPQERKNDKSFQTLTLAIGPEGWARHFEQQHISSSLKI